LGDQDAIAIIGIVDRTLHRQAIERIPGGAGGAVTNFSVYR
jgi:hypothetical protein